MRQGPHVAVCVATCERPAGLRALLRSLAALDFADGRRPELRVVIADNSPAGREVQACDELAALVPFPVEVLHERQPGIPFARNATVRAAVRAGAELIAFVDDDETVAPDWMDTLLAALDEHDAAAVTGPVVPVLPHGTPIWMLRGGFFERPRFPTGWRRPVAYTNNVLVRTDALTSLGKLFDEELALTGSSDSELFQRFAAAGHGIVWIDDALVFDHLPASRVNVGWLLRRRYARASVDAHRLRTQAGPWSRTNLKQLTVAFGRVTGGPFRALAALPHGRHVAFARLRDTALNLGTVTGALGVKAEEYRVLHGDPDTLPERTSAGALFVLPLPPNVNGRPVAGWFSAAATAEAAARRHGEAWLVTRHGLLSPREARDLGDSVAPGATVHRTVASRLMPAAMALIVKDIRRVVRARRDSRRLGGMAVPAVRYEYVWQRHDVAFDGGWRLARRLGAPLVLSVHALQMQEGQRWGHSRPGAWARFIERRFETALLRRADVVACVSSAVADDAIAAGVPRARVVVVPNGVDTTRFGPHLDGGALRRALHLEGRFVVGWVGSFHRFHGLELLISAAAELTAEIPDLALLLVGDGHDRRRIEHLAEATSLAGRVHFTGAVASSHVPEHIAAMDVAVVTFDGSHPFHYSPLKLREYLACGRPVIAPAAGEIADELVDGEHAVLVAPGDPRALRDAIAKLSADPEQRGRLGNAGSALAGERWSWDGVAATLASQARAVGSEEAPVARRRPTTKMKALGEKATDLSANLVRPLARRRPAVTDRVVFVRPPKCGGISLARSLEPLFKDRTALISPTTRFVDTHATADAAAILGPGEEGFDAVMRIRQTVLTYELARQRTRFVHGHFAFDRTAFEAFGDRYQWITVLRDPVERFVSHYFFNRFKEGSDHARIDVGLDDFVAGSRAAGLGQIYVKLVGGLRDDGAYNSADAVSTACENLERFAVLGLLEDVPSFLDAFERRFGVRPRTTHRNKRPAGARDQRVSNSARARIEELCAPDRAVYERARELIGARRRSMG